MFSIANLLEELLSCQVLSVLLVLADDHDLAIVHVQRELALLVSHRLDRSLDSRVSDAVVPEGWCVLCFRYQFRINPFFAHGILIICLMFIMSCKLAASLLQAMDEDGVGGGLAGLVAEVGDAVVLHADVVEEVEAVPRALLLALLGGLGGLLADALVAELELFLQLGDEQVQRRLRRLVLGRLLGGPNSLG